MSDCVFCRIVAKQIPASVVHEDDQVVAFLDIASAIEVRHRSSHTPRSMEPACREPALLRPLLERIPGSTAQRCIAAQFGGPQRCVQPGLPLSLTSSCGDDAPADGGRILTARVAGQCGERWPGDGYPQVDPIEQGPRQRALVGVERARRAAAHGL